MSYSFIADDQEIIGTFGAQYGQPLSLFCWVKKPDWLATSSWLMRFGDSLTATANSVGITNNAVANTVRARSVDAADATSEAQANFADGAYDNLWAPVLGIFDSDTSREARIGTTSGTNATSRIVNATLDSLVIGNVATGGNSEAGGLVAEVAVWTRRLNEAEIGLLRMGVRPYWIAQPESLCYYPLDDNTPPLDKSVNQLGPAMGRNGTVFVLDHPKMRDLNLPFEGLAPRARYVT